MRDLQAGAALVAILLGVTALDAIPQQQQAPPPAPTTPATQQPQQPPPVFRADIDVIRLDVSVLDKDRKPVRGLAAEDFTVIENGKPQRVVAVSEIRAVENDPAPTAWMRDTPRDVASNDLADQLGDGRAIAIMLDDPPTRDEDRLATVRDIGHYVIESLRPSDMAAVIFPYEPGKTQDFTNDRRGLAQAVDRLYARDFIWRGPPQRGTALGGADMPYRYSYALARTECLATFPLIPALETVVRRLATIPNRRKTVIMVTSRGGVFGSSDPCGSALAAIMRDVLTVAQRGNINIYGFDPLAGMGRRYNVFLENSADETGGLSVVEKPAFYEGIDRMFAEDSSYYLVGFQTSNGRPDGRFRKIEVKVNHRGAKVRTLSGYYGRREGTLATPESRLTPSTNDVNMTGLMQAAPLSLRAVAAPVSLAAAGGSDVAIVLGVRLPAPPSAMPEQLTIVRNTYDGEGRTGPLHEERRQLTLTPTTGDILVYEVYQRIVLPPGRHEIRLNGASRALDRSASVYAEVDVPDFAKAPMSASPIVLGTRPPEAATRDDVLASLLPILPTSAREFGTNEQIVAFLRVFQGGESAITPVAMTTQILDIADKRVLDTTSTLAPEDFGASRSAGVELALPLPDLSRGPHLLAITLTRPGGATLRRDVVFRVR